MLHGHVADPTFGDAALPQPRTLWSGYQVVAVHWQLATGNWQLATGNWQLVTRHLATGNWQLATGTWGV